MSPLSTAIRREVRERAEERCEYCLLPENVAFHPHQIDHIVPKQHGGSDDLANLALACVFCNRMKGPNLATLDPDTGELVAFFNPRSSTWTEHFRLEEEHIVGQTPKGRATVRIFRFNDDVRIKQRRAL